MEYKINDIVVVLDSPGYNYTNRIAKVLAPDYSPKTHININIPHNKDTGGFNILKTNVRKATIEEVEQYVKDNKCTIEEILEICKNLYSKGTNYNCLHRASKDISNGKFKISPQDKCIRTNDGCKCCYDEGKFARLVDEQEELSFKSQLKKEDFYNTKIDVSKSPELSRLVQEKLFKLGFKWQDGSTQYLKYDYKFIKIGNNGRFSVTKYSSDKQVYPQDLGININNKQQNNVNKENNEGSISKVQGFDKQISSTSGARGVGLTSSRSKITLGIVNKPNKVGLSTCK